MEKIALRLATRDDDEFLYQLYASTREDEMRSASDAAQIESVLRLQYGIRKAQYEARFPGAQNWIILVGERAVGRHLIQSDPEESVFIDLAVLPPHQGRGIGTFVLEKHLQEATQTSASARLHVRIDNPAKLLYERLGFVVTGQDGVYYEMLHVPAPKP